MSTQGFDQCGTLPNQEVSGVVQHEYAPFLSTFDGDERHRRPCYRFTDRFGVSCICLPSFHIGFDVCWWHQPYLMVESK
ncbi:hypothetical protein FIV00_27910 [Labrenzia sp. THAF82]|nr:hypothetical protein FIV00_27910 [Labrenzia sp. THAF82]